MNKFTAKYNRPYLFQIAKIKTFILKNKERTEPVKHFYINIGTAVKDMLCNAGYVHEAGQILEKCTGTSQGFR